jgi:hypothetical protein
LGANDDLVDETSNANGIKFVELKYAVETGEAERIAVDGAAKAGGEEDGSGGSARKWSSQACLQCAQLRRRRPVVTSLTTQRNAVAMLYERMQILLKYIAGVINSKHWGEQNFQLDLTSIPSLRHGSTGSLYPASGVSYRLYASSHDGVRIQRGISDGELVSISPQQSSL